MSGSVPSLYLMVATASRPEGLKKTLSSIETCSKPLGYQGLVVIENGSPRGVEAIVEDADASLRAQYVYEPRANKSAALNRGLEAIGDGLVVFIDDDIRLDTEMLCAYSEAAKEHANAFFGGTCRVDYETPPSPTIQPFLPVSAVGLSPGSGSEAFYMGFNWAAYRRDILRLGGFNPEFGPGSPSGANGDETEMQMRLKRSGLDTVGVPDAIVWHYVPSANCSETWVSRRAFREGLAHSQFPPAERPFGGTARSVAALAWNGCLLLSSRVARNPERQLSATVGFRFRAGFLAGRLRTLFQRKGAE